MLLTSDKLKDPATLAVAQAKCRHDFLAHCRIMHAVQTGQRFKVMPHTVEIAKVFERVLSGELTRVTISIPPRMGKSELAKKLITHALGRNAAAKFILLSATSSLALQLSQECRDEVRHEAYKLLYPDTSIKNDTDSKAKWATPQGGGVYATGAEGQVTGFGAGRTQSEDGLIAYREVEAAKRKDLFAGAILYDDPLKPQDANSDLKREAVNQRYVSTIKNRINSRLTPIIIIAQRIHPNDLIGYVNEIEPGEWYNVTLPELTFTETGEAVAMDATKRTVEDLIAMRDSSDAEVRHIFETQHQQNPLTREGLEFPKDALRFEDFSRLDFSDAYLSYFADPADTGGDDFAGILVKSLNGMHYVTNVIYNTNGAEVNRDASVLLIKRSGVRYAQIEANSAWKLLVAETRRKLEAEGYYACDLRGIAHTTAKHERILANSQFIRERFIFDKNYHADKDYSKFIKNLTAYRTNQSGINRNAHDDAPDVCAMAAKHLRTLFK